MNVSNIYYTALLKYGKLSNEEIDYCIMNCDHNELVKILKLYNLFINVKLKKETLNTLASVFSKKSMKKLINSPNFFNIIKHNKELFECILVSSNMNNFELLIEAILYTDKTAYSMYFKIVNFESILDKEKYDYFIARRTLMALEYGR